MAYLHCHNCDWSQGDFYDWRLWRKYSYNPISKIIRYVREEIRPRMVKYDRCYFEDRGVWCRLRSTSCGDHHYYGFETFSWLVLINSIKCCLKSWWRMAYTTDKKYKEARAKGTDRCPDCGDKRDWDID